MGFGRTNENEVFNYDKIRRKNATTKKLLSIKINDHLNFYEHSTNKYKRASTYREGLLFLVINRKR